MSQGSHGDRPSAVGRDAGATYRISLCMTCMGRLEHVVQTLPLAVSQNPERDVEFVLVNYNSRDGLHEWVQREMRREVDTGRLKYVFLNWPTEFHMAHAKNVSHRAASGEILVNVDADNFATHAYVGAVRAAFAEGNQIVRFDRKDQRIRGGGSGRIAIDRGLFDRLTGYDETMRGWGYEDTDLVERAKLLRARIFYVSADLSQFIRHDDGLRLLRCARKDRAESELKNCEISRENVRRRLAAVNSERGWGLRYDVSAAPRG
jgi:glycosyltransferase involved in cell wall biosynthesis